MAITKRLVKGSPLTAAEHDANVDAFDKFKGRYTNLAAITAALTTPNDGDYAYNTAGTLRFYAVDGTWQSENLSFVPPTAAEQYADTQELVGEQSNQVDRATYEVVDASDDPAVAARGGSSTAHYRYLGSVTGDLTAYELLPATSEEIEVYSQDTSGSVIKFDKPRNYGNISLLTGSITFDFTDAKFMATAFVAHRATSINLPQNSIITQGNYAPNEVNYIQFIYLSDSKVLVYFNKISTTTTNLLTWNSTGSAFNTLTSSLHKLRNTDATFQNNYAITSETFQKGDGITFKMLPIAPSTTAKIFVAFVDSVNPQFSQNVYSGFTIRGNEARFWNGTNTTFALTLTDISAKFTVSIDQNNNCRFTSDIDGDFVTMQNVPDGAFVQIWYADENGTDTAYPIGSANDYDIYDIAKITV